MLRPVLTCMLAAGYASAACSRAALQAATDSYVHAQANGTGWVNVSTNLTYTENDKPIDIRTGVLTAPMIIDHNRSIHDTVQCASFTELIAAKQENPTVIGTRILYTPATNGSLLAHTVESVVTKTGDWAFNATSYLHWNSLESWAPIPEAQRDTREAIKAAGDAYFDRFNNVNISVPFGVPCDRLEGGAYTGAHDLANNTCDLGLPSNLQVTNRRYVVDEALGVVDIFLGFPGLDRSVPDRPAPDSHMFRVQGGKIRYIHTLSACFNPGCGFNGTIFGRGWSVRVGAGARWTNRTVVGGARFRGRMWERRCLNGTAWVNGTALVNGTSLVNGTAWVNGTM